jgi:CRP-like cAMP-binding protein
MLGMDLGELGLSPLLVGLREGEIGDLLNLAISQEYGSGEIVVEEGTPGDTMYMVLSGSVSVQKSVEAEESVHLATLGKFGDFFGEMVFVDVMPRSATVRACSKCRLLAFHLDGLKAFFNDHHDAHLAIVLNIARELSKRLRDADEVIVGLRSGERGG